jgi:hypothetical protein
MAGNVSVRHFLIGGDPCLARRSLSEGGHPAWLATLRSLFAARSTPLLFDRRGPLPVS